VLRNNTHNFVTTKVLIIIPGSLPIFTALGKDLACSFPIYKEMNLKLPVSQIIGIPSKWVVGKHTSILSIVLACLFSILKQNNNSKALQNIWHCLRKWSIFLFTTSSSSPSLMMVAINLGDTRNKDFPTTSLWL